MGVVVLKNGNKYSFERELDKDLDKDVIQKTKRSSFIKMGCRLFLSENIQLGSRNLLEIPNENIELIIHGTT